MSIIITAQDLTPEIESKIIKEVVVTKKDNYAQKKGFFKPPIKIQPFRVDEEAGKVYLPFFWALQNIPNKKRTHSSKFKKIGYSFKLELREVQKDIKEEVIQSLNDNGCHLISLFAGAGKTFFSVYLATRIKLKTLIICHRIILIDQWIDALVKSLDDPTYSVIKPGYEEKEKTLKMVEDSDFLLVNACNIAKIGAQAFSDIGLVIVDEAHIIAAEGMSKCLSYLSPRYLIFLTATPSRPDGLDGIFDFYIGKENKTVRKLHHPHTFYKIQTEFSYTESPDEWTALISSQALNQERNEFIISTLISFMSKFPIGERQVLILCKRVEQVLYYEKELSVYFKVSSLTGSNNTYSEDSQIIIGVFSKLGVGFSCDRLNTLVLASDVISKDSEDYLVQYLARIMRAKESKAIVLDFVDNNGILKRHFLIRKKQYVEHGGIMGDPKFLK